MAQRCCDHHISCPGQGNLDYDSPLANLSAERPDIDFYIGINWGWDRMAPPVGNWFTRNTCLGVCESGVSQAEADDCAARSWAYCVGDDWNGSPPGVPPPPQTGTPPFVPPLKRPLPLVTNNPETCIANCPDGIGFAYTTPPGRFVATSQILADRMAMSEACRFAVTAKLCLSGLNPSEVCTHSAYAAVVAATGGTAPISFSVFSGSLPPGIALSQGSGGRTLIFSGTPTVGGNYQFTIRADDSAGHFMQKTFNLKVGGIDQSTLPAPEVGVAYAETLTVSNMTLPFTWSVQTGTLPAGLSLNSASGEIFGTPTTAETKTFTIACADGAGITCTKQFTVTVATACYIDHFTATDAMLFHTPDGTAAGFDVITSANWVFINRARQIQVQPTIADYVCPDGRIYGTFHPVTNGCWTQALGGAVTTFGPGSPPANTFPPSDNDYFTFQDNTGAFNVLKVFFPGSGIVATLGAAILGAGTYANPMGPAGHLLWQDQNTLNWHLWTPATGDQNIGAAAVGAVADVSVASTAHAIVFGAGGMRFWDGAVWTLLTGLGVGYGKINAADHIAGMYTGGTGFFTWNPTDGLTNIGLPPGALVGASCWITETGLVLVNCDNGPAYYWNAAWHAFTDLLPTGHGSVGPYSLGYVHHNGYARGFATFGGSSLEFVCKLCSPP